MLIGKKDLDRLIESPSKQILDKMEKEKFYSMNEMSEILVGKRLYDRDNIKQYLQEPYKGQRFVPTEEIFSAVIPYLMDVAYVESFLMTQLALGNIVQGFKDNIPYFAKK